MKIDLRQKGRPKRSSRNVDVESPEFQLLVRLYVPSDLLITNNKVKLKDLMRYLPTIVNDTLLELNYEIHLFLSYIVSSYVLSWYLLKLNTDDTSFVTGIYLILCEFVRDFSARILKVVQGHLLLHVINDAGNIIARHLDNNRIENGYPHFYYNERDAHGGTLYQERTLKSVKKQYLAANHVLFDNTLEANGQTTEDALALYFRILSRKILDSSLANSGESVISPIAQNLVTVILGELVLLKVAMRLSRPEFVFKTVIGKSLSAATKKKLPKKKKHIVILLLDSLRVLFASISSAISGLMLFWKQQVQSTDFVAAENWFLVPLLNAVFSLRQRRPFAIHIGGILVSVLFSICGLKRILETIIGRLVLLKISQSSLLEDSTLAGVVKKFRETIFERVQDEMQEMNESNDLLKDTARALASAYLQCISSGLVLGAILLYFVDEDTKEADMTNSIEQFLSVFNDGSVGPLADASEMNTLLVMDLIDCVVQYLYPELTI